MKPSITRTAKFYNLSNNGTSAVEFALIAPILLVLLIGILDFGLLMNMRMKLENLSRSVAEYLLQGGSEDDAWEDVIVSSGYFNDTENLADTLTLTTREICACDDGSDTDCDDACGTGEYKRHFFEVDIEMNYTPITPTMGIAGNLKISGNTRLQSE